MTNTDTQISEMFAVGAHFGYSKSSRHSSVQDFIFGTKDGIQVIDLEHTVKQLEAASEKISTVTANGGKVIFVGSKNEAKAIIKETAEKLGMPYVNTRWIGGTLTNFNEIKKRITKLSNMMRDVEKGEYATKYNKKEQLDIDKQIIKLQKHYTGLLSLTELPKALIVIDSKSESIAVKEAADMNIPVISLSNTDCDIRTVRYPVIANDASLKSITYFVGKLAEAFTKATATKPAATTTK